MDATESKELKVQERSNVTSPAEQTRPGRVFAPRVDIFENEKELTLLADMPGVRAEDLNIDLRDDTLTLTGAIEVSEDRGEEGLFAEFVPGRYYRQFSLSEVIDQSKIDAKLKNGVLRLSLPKVEKAAPRRISVMAG